MSLRVKIIGLAIIPLLVAALATMFFVKRHTRELGERHARAIESELLRQKREELRHIVSILSAEIAAIPATEDDAVARERAKSLIRNAEFGEDGYFFAYDSNGVCLVHPRQPELVGKNLTTLKDANGRRLIPSLIETAAHGDGFQRYSWDKPSAHKKVDKLAYVTLVPRWGWMIGSGVYLDDVAAASRSSRAEAQLSVEGAMSKISVVALIAIVLVFAGTMTLNVSERRLADRRQLALAERIATLQEEERLRVSRELHDGVSQVLVTMKYYFELAKQAPLSELASGSIDKGLQHLQTCIADVRAISHALRPPILDELGLSTAIRHLTQEFEQRSGINVQFSDRAEGQTIPERQKLTLFRVAQEALTNIERHAQAAFVRLELGPGADSHEMALSISDDGRGFDANRIHRRGSAGIGLSNIRQRVEELGGRFRLESGPGRTVLSVTVSLR